MRPRLLDVLHKYVAPAVLGAITVDSYKRQVYSHQQEISDITKISTEAINKMQQELWGEKFASSTFKTKLQANSCRIDEVEQVITDVKDQINALSQKLNNNNLPSHETADNINLMKTYLCQELQKLESTKTNYVKELQETINKSDIFGFFSDFIEKYKTFIDHLSLEQLVALFNIIGYSMILLTLISITTLLIGDYLIEKLKLDIKYPKLAKYIRFKQSLNKHYLMFYMIMFYIIVLLFIIVNIYMLLLKYFV